LRHRTDRWGVLFALGFLGSAPAVSNELPATTLSYEIEVSLAPDTRLLEGRETIRWTNPSASTTVESVPLHLYLNAFAHESSTWMRTTLGRLVSVDDLLDLHEDPWGWNEPDSIRQGGITLDWRPISPDDGNPLDRSLIEVRLAEPVGPGETLELEVEFEARLPVPFARTGGFRDFFLVAQWFPKLAVFETAGTRGAEQDRWNAHQFHGRTEFYAEFADFDVTIGVPPGWSLVATGRGTQEGEHDGLVRHRYRQRAVHDFAFATGTEMTDVVTTHEPAGGGPPVEIHVFLQRYSEAQAGRWRRAAVGALDTLGARVGPYPYETLTVVMPPFNMTETWGMEYPTLFTGLAADPFWDRFPLSETLANESTIAHEFCHQYFYGLLATNEFEEAFLDEGFTQFWGNESIRETYGDDAGRLLGRSMSVTTMEQFQAPRPGAELPPLRTRPSFLARGYSIGQQFYARPTVVLRTLEGLFGAEAIDRIFSSYYQRWAFRHPSFEDFVDTTRDAAGDAVADFLLEAYSEPRAVDYRIEVFETERWSAPAGRVVLGESMIEPDDSRDGSAALAVLDPAALESDDSLTVEILDPGAVSGDRQGTIERRKLAFTRTEPEEGWERREEEFHVSRVRIAGPGWNHLPVEVSFRFADGAALQELWDGRAPYRSYRFVRGAPLTEVVIDPRNRIALDGNPVNNSELRVSDSDLARDWGAWLAATVQLLAEAASQWL
jgi:hypothetical protein